jgi:hypothetical protein
MGRRRKQHERLQFGATPWWLYGLLEQGQINMTEFVVWSIIRGYVKDETPGVFSPPPIDLSNREIARGTTLTVDRVRVVLKDLEDRRYLYRITGAELRELGLGGNRWLLLLAPQGIPQQVPLENFPLEIAGGNLAGGKIVGGLNNNTGPSTFVSRKTSRPSASAVDVVVKSSHGEGGTGEGVNFPLAIAGGNLAGGKIAGGNLAGGIDKEEIRAQIAATLKELHVFPPANFAIADLMLADPQFNTLEAEAAWLAEARAAFFRVFNQERAQAKSDAEAMRFTVTRLKHSDWGAGLDAVLTEADQHKHTPYAAFLSPHAPPTLQPGTVAAAQAVWNAVLDILESKLTRVNYDNWLRDTKALGVSIGRTALVVQVANDKGVEALSDRHSPVIERSLSQALEHVEGAGDLTRTLISVAFVTEATLSKREPQSKNAFPYSHAEPARRLWQRALGDLAAQMTRATFEAWLRDSKALGINGDGQTLVICVKNQYAVQWLESKLYNVTHRVLVSHLEYADGDEFTDLGLTPETVALRFVTPEMLAEDSVTAPETGDSDE